jgi:hypothetical protein
MLTLKAVKGKDLLLSVPAKPRVPHPFAHLAKGWESTIFNWKQQRRNSAGDSNREAYTFAAISAVGNSSCSESANGSK